MYFFILNYLILEFYYQKYYLFRCFIFKNFNFYANCGHFKGNVIKYLYEFSRNYQEPELLQKT